MIKNVKINEKLHKNLFKMKLNFNLGTINEVIEGMHKLIHKFGMMKDLEIIVEGGFKNKK